MQPQTLTRSLKAEARRLGFALCGACPAVSPRGITRFREWLEAGYAGEMHYLPRRAAAYEHPRGVLDGARSILMLGMHHGNLPPNPMAVGSGRVARYARGPTDYHDLIHERLRSLAALLAKLVPSAKVRGVVDSAPLLEREFAQLAGIGWIGKNTMLINRGSGSYFFLAALLSDVELQYDEPHRADHCGTCTACLDACPTNAFPRAYQLDATRCISYLTIELRSPIPLAMRHGVGDWLFGCDVCQEVCPWSKWSPGSGEPGFSAGADMDPVELAPLFSLDDDQFRRRFRQTPLWRSKRRGILRNAAIVLGNQGGQAALAPLTRGVSDADPMVRGASAWALGQLSLAEADAELARRLDLEPDEQVRAEIRRSLRAGRSGHSQMTDE